jgi:hypothetical protein
MIALMNGVIMNVTTERLNESTVLIKEALYKNFDETGTDSLFLRFLEIIAEFEFVTNELKATRVLYKRAIKRPKKS